MSPYDRIAAEYVKRPEPEPFEWYVEQHLKRGYVYSTPEFFIMGLPVNSRLLDLGVHPLNHAHQSGEVDCWYISAMAGDMEKAWDVAVTLPLDLPLLAWERDRGKEKVLSIHAKERIRHHSQKPEPAEP